MREGLGDSEGCGDGVEVVGLDLEGWREEWIEPVGFE